MTILRTKLLLVPLILGLSVGISSCGNAEKSDTGAHAEENHEEAGHDEEAEAERVTITAEAAQASGLVISEAGPGAIQETLELTGRIMLQPAARAEVHAPYPGPVRAVLRNVGDTVQRGQTLAHIESAESLQTYAIVTPIAGVVLERQTNIGDVTAEEPIFVVGDLSRLQAELNVVTRDIGRVNAGQNVLITALDGRTRMQARIGSVLPTADTHSQTLIARAPFAASASSFMRPGMAVRADVVLAEQQVAIAVPVDAVQTVEGRQVVFVRVAADSYEARPVALGLRGDQTVEITSGLSLGEAYVSENAFLVKAELGKGEASHDH